MGNKKNEYRYLAPVVILGLFLIVIGRTFGDAAFADFITAWAVPRIMISYFLFMYVKMIIESFQKARVSETAALRREALAWCALACAISAILVLVIIYGG